MPESISRSETYIALRALIAEVKRVKITAVLAVHELRMDLRFNEIGLTNLEVRIDRIFGPFGVDVSAKEILGPKIVTVNDLFELIWKKVPTDRRK